MSIPMSNSQLSFTDVTQTMGGAISIQENQIMQTLQTIQNNPDIPTAQLAVFQANLQLWSNMIQMESSIIKVYGDTMKQVVTNMGS